MKRKYLSAGFFILFADLSLFNLIHFFLLNSISNPLNNEFIIVNNLLWLLLFYTGGIYISQKSNKLRQLLKVTVSSFTLLLFFNWLIFPVLNAFITDVLYCSAWLLASRLLIMGVMGVIDKIGMFKKRIVVIGYNELAIKLIRQFGKKEFTYLIDGLFADEVNTTLTTAYPVLGNIDACLDYAIRNQIQEIYTVLPPEGNERLYKIGEEAERNFIRFKIVPDLNSYLRHGHHFEPDHELTIMSLRPEPLRENLGGQLQKRIFDVVFSIFVVVFILSWLAPLLAVLIKLDSPGPVFFKQLRTGRKNRPFLCFKFRSLKINAEADIRQVTKNDSRYTRFGKFLRKSSLDELPQFFNVLAGDMSIVGSRPHMLKHTELYSRLHEQYMLRHNVKPGLTGWAQVNGYRGEIKADEQLISRVDHDLWYIENWNFWLDMRIVLQTVSATFKGDKNAY